MHDSKNVIVKDLSLLSSNRRMEDIVIIDNRVTSYSLSLENGIPIKDYAGEKYDKELKKLSVYLMSRILNATDVREVIKRDFLDSQTLVSRAKLYGY